ncbi:MAG TPA: hypothetical protein VMW27_29470 [Thermoanaerobaculia bacterium]|nr:hypothetical protein [Thermoanaerobaculia bacterium]
MQVTNSTGLDADFKVTSGGATRVNPLEPSQLEEPPTFRTLEGGEESWLPLRPNRYAELPVNGNEPPYEVTFRFKDAAGVETQKTVLVDHPDALVLLAEAGAEVKVFYPDEKAA